MGAAVKRPAATTSASTSTPPVKKIRDNSDSDFLTEDEEINKRLAARQLKKKQNHELFTSALRDLGITKTMEKAGG